MAILKNAVCLLALFAILNLAAGVHQDLPTIRQEEQDIAEDADSEVTLDDLVRKQGWAACDWLATAKFTCHDCTTRMICKPIGGILKYCDGTTPYCRNGFCSAIPSDECAEE